MVFIPKSRNFDLDFYMKALSAAYKFKLNFQDSPRSVQFTFSPGLDYAMFDRYGEYNIAGLQDIYKLKL